MERRNRTILVILIGIVIVVAVFSSFGLNLFTGDTPQIILPTATAPEPSGSGGTEPSATDGPVQVEVTADTVQNVIAALVRPESYYRVVTIEDYWGGGEAGTTTAKVWADSGWVKVESTSPSGVVRTSLVGEGRVSVYYGNSAAPLTGPADEHSADLEGQRIPTYEDVLAMEKEDIAGTGYEEKGGLPCIFVEAADQELGYRERYWVSVDTGLLVAAETWDGEELAYRMYSYALERPCPAGVLPPE